ncbi:MAG: threonine-phosphate decarboxylase CobD [Vulcanimicrobiaceae bacterium]
MPVHGGDLAEVGRRYGVDPAELLDFSANLNPAGPPAVLVRELALAAADIAELQRYPDPDARGLRTALARHLDIEPDAIVVGNGAAALIGIALAALRVRSCVVPTPAFSEYRHAVTRCGATWSGVALEPARAFALDPAHLLTALRTERADACIITNPHNPSGALTPRDVILELAHDARACGAATIVDEAFIEYAPEATVTRDAAAGDASLLTIRSLTKFFAVPALRVGYAVAAPALARRMRGALPSWPVTTLAARALGAALDDAGYARRAVAENERARSRLAADLSALGCVPNTSAANFLLVALPPAHSAAELVRRLVLDDRIVVRDCSSYEGLEAGRFVRVAVRSVAENARLISALTRAL